MIQDTADANAHLALCSEVIWKNNVPQQCHAETTMELAAGVLLLSTALGKKQEMSSLTHAEENLIRESGTVSRASSEKSACLTTL